MPTCLSIVGRRRLNFYTCVSQSATCYDTWFVGIASDRPANDATSAVVFPTVRQSAALLNRQGGSSESILKAFSQQLGNKTMIQICIGQQQPDLSSSYVLLNTQGQFFRIRLPLSSSSSSNLCTSSFRQSSRAEYLPSAVRPRENPLRV